MSQGGVFEIGVDLLDDRVPAVGLVRGNGVQSAGGEERVEPPCVKQRGLAGNGFEVEVWDPTDHQPARDLLALAARGERNERDLRDLSTGNPPPRWFVEHRLRVLG